MLRRVRRSSWSSLEELEMERTASSSKLIKHDSLSIYENTLMKLKQGSRCDLSLSNVGSTETDINHVTNIILDGEEAVTLDGDCSSAAASPNLSYCHSIGTSNEQQSKNVSVLFLFSRYKNSRYGLSSPDQKAMVIENGCFSSDTSQIPNDCQLVIGTS